MEIINNISKLLFDEVSTARREDLQSLLGIGFYAKEKW